MLFSTAGAFRVQFLFVIFYFAMMFAFPVWCLYLPVVIATRNTDSWRFWTTLVAGVFMGPPRSACGVLLSWEQAVIRRKFGVATRFRYRVPEPGWSIIYSAALKADSGGVRSDRA